MNVFSHPDFDNHEQVSFVCDPATGLRAIIAIHNTSRGPTLGGCRMYPYASEEEALRDVLRLSRGMTYKSALANLDLGGGKAVIIGDPHQHKTEALLEAMGRAVDKLGGQYIIAEDSGTSVADLKVIARHTQHVAGIASGLGFDGKPTDGDPAPATAYGVFVGLKAAVKHRLGRTDLTGLKVAIQGVGNVGYLLARHLNNAGAELWVYDIRQENMDKAITEFGAKAATAEDILFLPVDVIAPCALGAILNGHSIPKLQAQVIAGAANNQLATPVNDLDLLKRGILYAPDFVLNAGGIINVFYEHSNQNTDKIWSHTETISETLNEIFTRSDRDKRPTGEIANELAEERFSKKAKDKHL